MRCRPDAPGGSLSCEEVRCEETVPAESAREVEAIPAHPVKDPSDPARPKEEDPAESARVEEEVAPSEVTKELEEVSTVEAERASLLVLAASAGGGSIPNGVSAGVGIAAGAAADAA